MVRSASSATVSAVIPPAASMAFLRQAPSAPGTTVMQFSKSKARFSMFWLVTYSRASQRVAQRRGFAAIDLMKDVYARVLAKIAVQQFAGAVARAVVDHDDSQVFHVRGQNGLHRLHDYGFFVVRGNEHGHARQRIGHRRVIGAQLLNQRQNSDDQGPPANHHDAYDKDGRDAEAQPMINPENKSVGARFELFLRG